MDERKREQNSSAGMSYGTSNGLFGQTDRDSGEYRFRSGYTQQVYSNADYIPENEHTVPPKYYRPSLDGRDDGETDSGKEKNRKKNRKKASSGFVLVLVLCFMCALIGGALAGILTARYYTVSSAVSHTGEEAEEPAAEAASDDPEGESISAVLVAAEPTEEPDLNPSEIYSLACSQVVSISTDIVNVDRYGNQTPSVISGSGFIVSSDGYIITNYHVIEYAANAGINVTVSMYDGSIFAGSIVGTEADTDLAVIKIEKDGLMPAVLGDSDMISVGDTVYAVGNPYGVLEFTMTVGHVSALNRLIATDENEDNACNMFQIDAAVYSGNSGGPAFNSRGEVIGIVSAKYSEKGMEGIGFAIPVNDALPIVAELLDKGYVGGKASLSASFDERYNSVYSRYYRLPEGAYVYSVEPGGASDRAGLRSGDIVMKIGDYSVSQFSDVASAIRHYKAGDSVGIVIYREGSLLSTTLTFDEFIPPKESNSISAFITRSS